MPSYRLDPIDGSFDPLTIEHSYENILPSFNFNAELAENLKQEGVIISGKK